MPSRPSAPPTPAALGERPDVLRAARTAARVPHPTSERPFWMAEAAVRGTRLLGSLQVAIVLLAWFAAVLALGTVVDSFYSPKVAQDLVYRTWWFKLLLLLLGVNIFAAAAKKWPWKRHQTGFLITHVGLLCLVAGGVMTSLAGSEGFVALIDTAQPGIQREHSLRQSAADMVVADQGAIRVRQVNPASDTDTTSQFAFEPGPLPWDRAGAKGEAAPPLLTALDWLEHPAPRRWQADLGGGVTLRIVGYYPHTREEDYSPAESGGFPAVKVQLQSALFGQMPERWLALRLNRSEQSASFGPGTFEFLGHCPPGMTDEFLRPPRASELGTAGLLVVSCSGDTRQLPVGDCLGKSIDCGRFQVRCTRYALDFADKAATTPSSPAVEFDVTRDGTTTSYVTMARYAGFALALKDGEPARDPNALRVWYHPPDYRYGKDLKGLIEFAAGDDGRLYFRSFSSSAGQGFGVESSGEVVAGGAAQPVWQAMKGELRVLEYLPRAARRPRFVPEDAPPGLENERYVAAIRCRLERAGSPAEEFWLGQGRASHEVAVGPRHLEIGYAPLTRPLGFEVRLLRAEQTVDAGTQQAASFSSYVQVSDRGDFSAQWLPQLLRPLTNLAGLTVGGERLNGRDAVITMNQPLEHRGFKVYQERYARLPGEWDDGGKPVSTSRFAVARDPGLPFKYVGSTMLALGIACMYYMKAYFFKPRGARRSAASLAAG